jgi:hypothetical protein
MEKSQMKVLEILLKEIIPNTTYAGAMGEPFLGFSFEMECPLLESVDELAKIMPFYLLEQKIMSETSVVFSYGDKVVTNIDDAEKLKQIVLQYLLTATSLLVDRRKKFGVAGGAFMVPMFFPGDIKPESAEALLEYTLQLNR